MRSDSGEIVWLQTRWRPSRSGAELRRRTPQDRSRGVSSGARAATLSGRSMHISTAFRCVEGTDVV